MNWYLYILLCDKNVFYTGITKDIEKRVREHEEGKSTYTKRFSEIKLVYYEKHKSKEEAVSREKQIKGWNKEKKKKLIKGELGVN